MVCGAECDIRNVKKQVDEGRSSELVILCERSFQNVEAQTTRICDHDIRNVSTRVVYGKNGGYGLERDKVNQKTKATLSSTHIINEQGQERTIGRVWVAFPVSECA